MSARHPIIGVTGSSGAGTSTAQLVFERLFAELKLRPAMVEGDAFHAVDRDENKRAIERARIRGENFSLFGPAGNLLQRLEQMLADYGKRGAGIARRYLHTETEAIEAGQPAGTFTPWQPLAQDTDVLFYEGLHGGYAGEEIDIAQHMDLLIGVVPVINLEWIQKIHRDTSSRGQLPQDVTHTILRRMPDYVNHIIPQFSRTDINFQRVPLVDTSNPFAVRDIPSAEHSLVVIHFNDASRVRANFGALIERLPGAFVSNTQTLVVPGPLMETAMELIMRSVLEKLLRRRDTALRRASV